MRENNIQIIERESLTIKIDVQFVINKPTLRIVNLKDAEVRTLDFKVEMFSNGKWSATMWCKYSPTLLKIIERNGYGVAGHWTEEEAKDVWGEIEDTRWEK